MRSAVGKKIVGTKVIEYDSDGQEGATSVNWVGKFVRSSCLR